MRALGLISGQPLKRFEVSSDERFLLRPTPPFQSPFGRDRIGDPLKRLAVDEFDRTPRFGVAAKCPSVVFRDTPLQASAR